MAVNPSFLTPVINDGIRIKRNPLEMTGVENDGFRMASAKSEEEWAGKVATYLKAELKKAGSAISELAKRLKKHGFKEARRRIPTGRSFAGDVYSLVSAGLSVRVGGFWNAIGGCLGRGH